MLHKALSALPRAGETELFQSDAPHLEWENDDFAALGPLDAGIAIGLEAREGRKRDLLLSRVLPNSGYADNVRTMRAHPPWALYTESTAGASDKMYLLGGSHVSHTQTSAWYYEAWLLLTIDKKLTSPPIWMRPTWISTTVPLPLA